MVSCASGQAAAGDAWEMVPMASVAGPFAAIAYAVPVQLLAYHTALEKGTDVDQPCNLAKSVTVE
jgi:glucosamine--fructose-6-phosphate aminotransferase (isomerizing)